MIYRRLAPTSQALPLSLRIGFGAGDFAFNLFWTGASLFLLYYYTDVMGLPPVQAGLVYFLAMVLDAISDPLMGALADRTRTKWGRYRPYLIFGAIPLALSYPLAYWSAGLEGAALFAWALLTHALFRTLYTVVTIPYTSLQARVTSDPNARSTLAAWRVIGAATGGLTVAFATPVLVALVSFRNAETSWIAVASAWALLSLLLIAICLRFVKEPAIADDEPIPASFFNDFGSFLRTLRHNLPLVQILAVVIIGSVAGTMFAKNILYFFKYNLGAPSWASIALVVPAATMLIGAPFWTKVSQRIGKRETLIACCLLGSAGYLVFFLNPSLDPAASVAIMIGIGLAAAGNSVMFWAILPDTIEYGEAKTGNRHEAKVFGVAMFAMKSALGINALLLGWLLDVSGYVANQVQGQETLTAIKTIMTMFPMAGVLACVAVFWKYPISARFHQQLREEIAANRQAPIELR